MKTLLMWLCIVVVLGASDLNPLLLWKPYEVWINRVMGFSPTLFAFVFLSALFVGACLAASEERKKKTAL